MRSASEEQVDQGYVQLLGQAIRTERVRLGFSQERFAHRVGFDRGYMGRVERGQNNLTFGKLIIVLRAFGAKPRDFFRDIRLRVAQPRDVSKYKSLKNSHAWDDVSVVLGDAIRYERELADLSQEALATRVGKSRSYISDLECGHGNPTFGVLMQLLEGIEVEPADFFRHFAVPKRRRTRNSAPFQ